MRKLIIVLIPLFLTSCTKSAKFQLLDSKETGIEFNNKITESDSLNILTYEYIYNGAGTGAGDLNNDGLTDIVFAGNQVSSRIYLNLGNFRFKDITSNFKGLTNNQWYSGVALIDINNDGWLDVYLTSTAGSSPEKCRNRLWVNNGIKEGNEPSFTEMAEKYGIANEDQSVSAAFFDYDLDGYPDLYILNNVVNSKIKSEYRKKITDGSAINNDRLYHNNGNGTFTDVTIQAGIVYEGFGMGLAISDVNKDGYPDIYVSNDLLSNDLLYINQKDGTFRNEISRYLSYQSRTSKGNDIADVNNDGNPDIFTLDIMPVSYAKKKQTINGFNYLFYVNDDAFGFEHQYLRNMLHMHNGFLYGDMLPFSEEGQLKGIWQSDWSWSSLFADFDNDGDKDLIITNGFPRDITDKDWTRFKIRASGMYATDRTISEMTPAQKVPNMAFENKRDSGFVRRKNWLPDLLSFSYGASYVDLDNDGDLDYIVNNVNEKAFVLKNTTSERSPDKSGYIRIKLKGKGGNLMGIGAVTELWAGGTYQYDEHFLSRGYASSVDPVIHFGIGKSRVIDSLKVTWPGRKDVTILKNVKANQTIDLNKNDALRQSGSLQEPAEEDKIFTRCDSVVNYRHEQNDFNDFSLNQKILPHKFSQIGPVMAKGDIDGDGREDIIIGATNKLPTTVLLRRGTGFKNMKFAGLTDLKGFSESDIAVLDIDKDGDNDIVVIAGGYENTNESEYKHFLYRNNNGVFERSELPIPQFPASVIRPCDYDHDGYTDLFIGGRVKYGMFPYSNHSWLLHNDGGKLKAEPSGKLNLGLVTDALWTDYDKDGWEDLLVAREWNSIVLMKNINGKEFIPQNIPELENAHGLWYSLAAGDFDKDGDEDYIAGNFGNNHRFTITDEYPLNLYAVDVDKDGIIDPLLSYYAQDKFGKMTEYPVNYLDELWSQSKYFEEIYGNYTAFSYLGIKEILNAGIMKRLEFGLYVNTTSTAVIWNDKGKFRIEKLPLPVQVSPVKEMLVQDFNNDGWPDVLMTGNDYTYNLSTGYIDANKGLLLINKGSFKKGDAAFTVVEPSKSGIILQGMVGSLLLFKADTSLIVAGINRAGTAVFKYH